MKLCVQCEAPERRHKVGTSGAITGNTQSHQSDSKEGAQVFFFFWDTLFELLCDQSTQIFKREQLINTMRRLLHSLDYMS